MKVRWNQHQRHQQQPRRYFRGGGRGSSAAVVAVVVLWAGLLSPCIKCASAHLTHEEWQSRASKVRSIIGELNQQLDAMIGDDRNLNLSSANRPALPDPAAAQSDLFSSVAQRQMCELNGGYRGETHINPDQWFIMLRLQKTGTTALGQKLAKMFPKENMCEHYMIHCQTYSPQSNIRKLLDKLHGGPCVLRPWGVQMCASAKRRFIIGDVSHFDMLDIQKALNKISPALYQNAILITNFRDPLHRVVSEYNHWTRHPDMPAEQGRLAWDYLYPYRCHKTLLDFVKCDEVFPVHNRQARMLAGTSGEPWEDSMLDRAMQNLERLNWFGILDRPEESMWLYNITFPRRAVYDPRPERVTGLYSAASRQPGFAEAVAIIKEKNAADYAVYNAALALFQKRLDAATDDIARCKHLKALDEQKKRDADLQASSQAL